MLRLRQNLLLTTAICSALAASAAAIQLRAQDEGATGAPFRFQPLAASAACVIGSAGTPGAEQPFILPDGFVQTIIAREGDGGTTDNWDMNTVNETGPHAGRFLYRSHETPTNGQVTVTDLGTGTTRVLAQRVDWNRMDGIVWTPWHTLLIAEEMRPERQPSMPDPLVPQAQAGRVYEVDPVSGANSSVTRSRRKSARGDAVRFARKRLRDF